MTRSYIDSLSLTDNDRSPITIENEDIQFFYCPTCRKKYTRVPLGNCSCSDPLYYATSSDAWTTERAPVIRCDKCSKMIPCADAKDADGYTELLCSDRGCDDSHSYNSFIGHTVGIQNEGQWYRPKHFLLQEGRSGIMEADNQRDRITLDVLHQEARPENLEFRSIDKSVPARIYWKENEAVGYYTYTMPPVTSRPTLHQIFVRDGKRHKGIAIDMIRDFMDKNPGELAIESPNDSVLNLLCKMGEATIQDSNCISTGRIGFISGM
jgi:hypothetical protein